MRFRTKWLWVLFVVLVATTADSQTPSDQIDKAQRLRDEALQADTAPRAPSRAEEKDEAPEADDTPLGVDLEQIVLVPMQDAVSTQAAKEEGGFLIADEGVIVPEGLAAELESTFAYQPLSLASLQELVKTVIAAWRVTDYPLVDVYLAPQNITGGKVQLVVREAVLGEVQVEGAKHSDPDFLTRQVRVEPGGRINALVIEEDLDWLNENPSRRVDLVYERGEADGTSDIILKTEEFKPFSFYTGFANSGLESTGMNEWSLGLNWNRAFGTEQIVGYNYGTDADWQHLQSHTALWQIPFERTRHTLTFLGAWVTSEASSDSAFLPVDIHGESRQFSADYKVPLPPLRLRELNLRARQALHFAADYKSTNTDILFGGTSFFDTTAEVVQFRLGYDLEAVDQHGYTRLDLGINLAPGHILQHNNDEDFSALRDRASADYWYGTAGIERFQELPADWSLRVDLDAQFTDSRLLSTEQQLAGGYRTVRGFDENLVRGDSGAILSVELGPPPFSVLKQDRLQVFGFYDAAFLHISESREGEVSPSLQSVGLGLNWRICENAVARAAYGWGIADTGVDDVNSGKVHFGVTVTY